MKYNKIFKTFLMACLFFGTITFAFGCDNNEHNFSSAWSKDDYNHWHDCTDENCEEKNGLSAHTYSSWEFWSYEDAPIGMIVEKRFCSVCGHEETRIINPNHSLENAYEIDLSQESEYYGFSVTEGNTYYVLLLGDSNVSKSMHICSELYSPIVNMWVDVYNSSNILSGRYDYYTEIVGMSVNGGDYIVITALNSGRIVFDFN